MRELLPDWLLPPAYAFRRAFLPRHGRFRLDRAADGRFRLVTAGRLPHGRVRLRPLGWPPWEALELEGEMWSDGSATAWSICLEPPVGQRALEIELPHGLRALTARLDPDPGQLGQLELELDELGALARAWALLGDGSAPGLLELRRALEGPGPMASVRGGSWTLGEAIDRASYARWLRAFESPSPAALARLRARAGASGLRVSVVTSLRDDAAAIAGQLPGRVEVVRSVAEASGDVVVPLGPGVVLAPHALPTLVAVLDERPEAAMLFADVDHLEEGRRTEPDFRPVLGPELLRSRNALRGLIAVRRADASGAPALALDDAALYGWALGCTSRLPAERIRRVPLVLATLDDRAAVDAEGERAALRRHLEATGTAADVEPGLAPGLHHVRYRLPAPEPRVALVVPTRNARALVETCIASVRRLTRYSRYEIHLVDNGSDAPDALEAFAALARSGEVLLHRDSRPFNFSALNNAAVRRTDAELVCLLNNDVEALHPEWLTEMVSVALQPGVGAVGAKLLYPDGRIQHGGVLVGLHGTADHAYAGAPGNAPGHARQLLVRREVSAVTAACLVVRRALYLEVGGLDEEVFPVSFNDVDFCLKLRARGHRNVWTPHARLVHHESASRGKGLRPEEKARADRELAALRSRWASALVDDPYHSPNLSLSSKVPRLAWPPRERRPWSL
ncbi:MAG TPA: glycosyltransferase family 2 protein [Myxococcaceae bacterium]|nr:glycosyltransferase family 2 protein [Myxococcaceae bacterium]